MDKDSKKEKDMEVAHKRQQFQMHQKGYKDITNAIESLKEVDKPEIQKVELTGISVVTLKGDKGDKPTVNELKDIIEPLLPTDDKLESIIKPLIPKPLKGEDGKDYIITEKDKKDIAKSIKVPVVEKVIEKQIIEKPIITEVVKEVAKYEDAEDIAKKLDGVKKEWLSIDAIRGDFNKRINRMSGGGVNALRLMSDVDLKDIKDNDIIQYDSTSQSWKNVTPQSIEDVDWGEIGGDIANQTDINDTFLKLDQTTPQTTVGRFTFPALTVDTNSLFVDSVNHRVGIGTTTPGAKLEVAGSVLLPATSSIQFGTTWNSGTLSFLNGPTTAVAINVPAGKMQNNLGKYLTASSNVGQFGTQDNYGLALVTNSIERLRIDTAGNVGIGTTNPGTLLEISKSNFPVFSITDTQTGGASWGLASGRNTAGDFDIAQGSASKLTIQKTTGNVGIGTTTPNTKLDVFGVIRGGDTASTNGSLILAGRYADNQYVNTIGGHYASAGTVIGYAVKPKNGAAGYVSSADNIAWTRGAINLDQTGLHVLTGVAQSVAINSDVVMTEKFSVTNLGNVGIGTTSPTAVLHLKAGTATAGTAPLKLTSGTNLTTPEAGAVEYDGNNIFSTSNSLLRKTIPGVVFTQIADKTIGNTTTETTMFSTGVGSLTIPANSLVAGRTYRIKLKGYASGTNGDTSTLKVKLGSTELVSSTGTWQTLTDIGFTLEFDFTCRTTGATGTVAGNGYSLVSGGQGFSTISMRALLAGTDTLNTTIDQVIDLTYQWSSASAGNTVTITNASIEVLN